MYDRYIQKKPMYKGRNNMSLLGFMKRPDINQGVEEYRAREGAVLLDVRTPEEYAEGHVPGSVNVPLQSIDKVASALADKTKTVFVYCRSGARSSQAVAFMKQMGYTEVHNIGGILDYNGKVEK